MSSTATEPAIAPDPRLAERRRQVEGARRTRVRRRVLAGLAVVTVLAALWGAVQSPLLDVEVVAPLGVTEPVQADAVVAATGVRPGDPLVFVDPGEIARRVERLPWVDTASVRRAWPAGAVEVAVTRRDPAAAVPAADGRWLLVDRTGQAIAESPDAAGVPVLGGVAVGAPGDRLAPVDQVLVEVAAALTPGLATRVAEPAKEITEEEVPLVVAN